MRFECFVISVVVPLQRLDGRHGMLLKRGCVVSKEAIMLTALIVILLLVLLFGGLGIFVAKVFLLGLLLALLVGAFTGFAGRRRGGHI